MQIFYREFADGTFRFKDGNLIKASKAILSAKNETFHKLITESSEEIIDIPDYDKATFQLFLDCFMGFRKCNFQDALKIFPIAIKWQAKKLIEECIGVLTPTVLNKDVPVTMNLAISTLYRPLMVSVLNFLCQKRLYNKFMNSEELFLALEPKPMALMLTRIKIDSVIVKTIFEWGEEYLKRQNAEINLKSFFAEHKIDRHFFALSFESAKCYYEFIESDIGKKFPFIEFFGKKPIKFHAWESEWVEIKSGEIFIEELVLFNLAHFNDHTTKLVVLTNHMVFYDFPESDDEDMVTCKYSFYFENAENVQNFEKRKVSHLVSILKHFGPKPGILMISLKKNIASHLHMKIEYNVKYDCRILKTSATNFKPDKDFEGKLFFTESVNISYIKKE